jgi:predicted nucleotidyltransferase
MSEDSLSRICRALGQHTVRYLLVGGHAVGAHGYARATQDIDLVVALDSQNARNAITALSGLGYRPIAPVDAHDFCDEKKRLSWVKEKKAVVFQLATGNVVDQPVDLFIQEPFSFEEEYAKATLIEYAPGVIIPVVSLAALIAMKVTAGRPRDLLDIDELKKMAE